MIRMRSNVSSYYPVIYSYRTFLHRRTVINDIIHVFMSKRKSDIYTCIITSHYIVCFICDLLNIDFGLTVVKGHGHVFCVYMQDDKVEMSLPPLCSSICFVGDVLHEISMK